MARLRQGPEWSIQGRPCCYDNDTSPPVTTGGLGEFGPFVVSVAVAAVFLAGVFAGAAVVAEAALGILFVEAGGDVDGFVVFIVDRRGAVGAVLRLIAGRHRAGGVVLLAHDALLPGDERGRMQFMCRC